MEINVNELMGKKSPHGIRKKVGLNIVKTVRNQKGMSDEKKARIESRIIAKLEAGKKLTKEELDFLRQYNPALYTHALRVQRMAKALEEQLKHARSKEEADRILTAATAAVSKKDPDREYIMASISRISSEFHSSGAYKKLPDTMKEAKEQHSKGSGDVFSDAKDEDDELKIELRSWSPLTEVYDSLPSFNTGA